MRPHKNFPRSKFFEDACKELKIPLYVLPPRTPKYNGGVERSNRTVKEEFYMYTDEDTVKGLRQGLKNYLNEYNSYRPHFNLNGGTPISYLKNALGDFFVSKPLDQHTFLLFLAISFTLGEQTFFVIVSWLVRFSWSTISLMH